MWATASATAGAMAPALPDIEIDARVQAREVRVGQDGRAQARIQAQPNGGGQIDVERNLPKGQRSYRDLDLRLQVEARIADPLTAPSDAPEQASTTTTATGDN